MNRTLIKLVHFVHYLLDPSWSETFASDWMEYMREVFGTIQIVYFPCEHERTVDSKLLSSKVEHTPTKFTGDNDYTYDWWLTSLPTFYNSWIIAYEIHDRVVQKTWQWIISICFLRSHRTDMVVVSWVLVWAKQVTTTAAIQIFAYPQDLSFSKYFKSPH